VFSANVSVRFIRYHSRCANRDIHTHTQRTWTLDKKRIPTYKHIHAWSVSSTTMYPLGLSLSALGGSTRQFRDMCSARARVFSYACAHLCWCACVHVFACVFLSLSPPPPALSVCLSLCLFACVLVVCVCVCVCVCGWEGGLQHLMKLELGLTPVVIVTISTAAIILPLAVVNDCGLEYDNESSTWCVLCDCVSDCVCSSRAPAHVRLLFVPTAYYMPCRQDFSKTSQTFH
jgi:hypothetical protein